MWTISSYDTPRPLGISLLETIKCWRSQTERVFKRRYFEESCRIFAEPLPRIVSTLVRLYWLWWPCSLNKGIHRVTWRCYRFWFEMTRGHEEERERLKSLTLSLFESPVSEQKSCVWLKKLSVYLHNKDEASGASRATWENHQVLSVPCPACKMCTLQRAASLVNCLLLIQYK